MAMDSIMQYVSEHKSDTSLMFMCTPTDVYAVPQEVAEAAQENLNRVHNYRKWLRKAFLLFHLTFFQAPYQDLLPVRMVKLMVCRLLSS